MWTVSGKAPISHWQGTFQNFYLAVVTFLSRYARKLLLKWLKAVVEFLVLFLLFFFCLILKSIEVYENVDVDREHFTRRKSDS